MERSELVCMVLRRELHRMYGACSVEWARHEATLTVDFVLTLANGHRYTKTVGMRDLLCMDRASQMAETVADVWSAAIAAKGYGDAGLPTN